MTNREVNGVSVVALDGRIVLGEESNALREKLKSLTVEGKKQIVLNMDNIKYIDSSGLGHWSRRIAARKPRAHRCACVISEASSRKCCKSPNC
jgi:anti-anti-sigma factor